MDQVTAGQGIDTRVWLGAAACADEPSWVKDAFFAFDGEVELLATARLVCSACPVRAECLQWALESGQAEGVWGGMTAEERRQLRQQQRRAAA